jgi:anti-anti-sigma factor
MTEPFHPWWLDIEQFNETLVVRFTQPGPLDEGTGYALSQYLSSLVKRQGGRHLVLNFGHVDYVTSMIIGRLLALNKELAGRKGRLTLCGVTAQLRELFDLVRLPMLIPLYETEEEALEALTALKARHLLRPAAPLRRIIQRARPALQRVR